MTLGRPRIHHDQTRKEILRLLDLGWPERQICKKLGVGKGTVNRVKRLPDNQEIKNENN